jgi:hypothetical protein
VRLARTLYKSSPIAAIAVGAKRRDLTAGDATTLTASSAANQSRDHRLITLLAAGVAPRRVALHSAICPLGVALPLATEGSALKTSP